MRVIYLFVFSLFFGLTLGNTPSMSATRSEAGFYVADGYPQAPLTSASDIRYEEDICFMGDLESATEVLKSWLGDDPELSAVNVTAIANEAINIFDDEIQFSYVDEICASEFETEAEGKEKCKIVNTAYYCETLE